MTKVVVEGNSLGTGKVTLKAPNIAEDIVVELPGLGGPISGFPPGTKMLFAQTAAPTGWTKDTTHNNKALRVVTGTAGSGGSLDFTTAFASKGVNGSVSVTGTVGNTALAEWQIPSHRHTSWGEFGEAHNWGFANGGGRTFRHDWGGGYAGGSGAHNHSFSGSGSFIGTNIDLEVQYVDVIIATKD